MQKVLLKRDTLSHPPNTMGIMFYFLTHDYCVGKYFPVRKICLRLAITLPGNSSLTFSLLEEFTLTFCLLYSGNYFELFTATNSSMTGY